ncbi:hypothetical protein [Nocardia carnea]|uniref:hypothetical protein n=1 Tax=Nocardia carnea TaxID=37328 RepID=UPI002454AEAF|nr:hypothetical protein [Nocardia carnea]
MKAIHKPIAAVCILLATAAGGAASAGAAFAAPPAGAPTVTQFQAANQPMRTNVPAALLSAAVISCAQGSLASVGVDILRDVANGGDQPDYVVNAVVGCFGGAGVGLAWKALPGPLKKQAIAMVVAAVIKYTPLD